MDIDLWLYFYPKSMSKIIFFLIFYEKRTALVYLYQKQGIELKRHTFINVCISVYISVYFFSNIFFLIKSG